MSNNKEDMGKFQGTKINYSEAYHDTRKLMGTKGTNLTKLQYNTSLLYVNAPEKWAEPFMNLIDEIELRHEMLTRV